MNGFRQNVDVGDAVEAPRLLSPVQYLDRLLKISSVYCVVVLFCAQRASAANCEHSYTAAGDKIKRNYYNVINVQFWYNDFLRYENRCFVLLFTEGKWAFCASFYGSLQVFYKRK